MELSIVNRLDRNQWKDFVDSCPESNIFHTPEMFEVYSYTRRYKPKIWAVIDDQGQIQALHFPVQVTLRGGILRYLSTRNINYGSILAIDNEIGKKALSLVLQKYNQQKSRVPLFTELRHASCLSHFQEIFQQHGYQYERHLNYFLNLDRDSCDILQSFGRQTRRKIRVNIRKGEVVIKEVTEPEMLPLFYETVKKTYALARVPLADISLFKAAFQVLMPKKMVRFTIAFVDEMPASAMVCLLYKDVMYGWYMGLDRSFGKQYPNEFIVWEAMEWGSENGYKVLDFGGAGHPDEESGVRNFKLKFRGDLVELGRNCCVHAPIRKVLCEAIYNLIRKIPQLTRMVSIKQFVRNRNH